MHRIVNFETWSELLEYAGKPLPSNAVRKSSVEESSDRTEFTLVKTYQDALTLAVTGWEDGTNQIKAYSESMINKVMDKLEVPTIHYDVTGMDFDISLVNQHIPECWYYFHNTIVENDGDRIVSIVVNSSTSAGVDTDVITKRGAVIAAIVELLEYAGKKVEVIHSCPWSTGLDASEILLEFRTVVKSANQPLDLSRLAYAVAHPAMYRRLGFHTLELNPDVHKKCGIFYGSVTDIPKELQGDIYFGKMQYMERELWNRNPEEYIKGKLREQGIEVKD